MLVRSRPVVAAVLTVSLATDAWAAESCPNEQVSASAEANLANCLGDAQAAKQAGDATLAAATYERAVMFARKAYDAGKVGATPGWFTDAGNEIVYYGTEGCSTAMNLTTDRARATLNACIELLELYLTDLGSVQADGSRSAEVARRRRDALRPLLAGLVSSPPDVVEAPKPVPESEAQPPARKDPLLLDDPVAQQPETEQPVTRPSRGIDAGIGVSVVAVGLGVVGLIVGGQLGRKASAAVVEGSGAGGLTAGTDVCVVMPSATGCGDLWTARSLYVASGVLLGAGLAATAVLVGLKIRQRRTQRRISGVVAPVWRGVDVAISLRF